MFFVVVCPFFCLFVSNFAQELLNGFARNFQGRFAVVSEEMIKFWWQSGSPSGYRDGFPDSSVLGDTESGINRLRCATLHCRACTSTHRHSNYDVITSPAHDRQLRQTCLGGGMPCPSASSHRNGF